MNKSVFWVGKLCFELYNTDISVEDDWRDEFDDDGDGFGEKGLNGGT